MDDRRAVGGGRSISALMALAAATLFAASAIHFGLTIPLPGGTLADPFAGAAAPEAVIGAVLAVGAVGTLVWWPAARPLAWGATLFAILGVVVGLNFTLPRGSTGDIAYHILLLVLVLSIALRLRRASTRG